MVWQTMQGYIVFLQRADGIKGMKTMAFAGEGQQHTQTALQAWEQSLKRWLNRSDSFWAGTVQAQTSDASELLIADRMPKQARPHGTPHTGLEQPQQTEAGSKISHGVLNREVLGGG